MKYLSSEGVVINRYNVLEADKILTVYSKNFGKLRLKAKGIRKISSKRGPSLELFNQIKFSGVSGRTLPILTEVEAISTFPLLRKHLTRIGIAFHLCELVDQLMPEELVNADVYKHLVASLKRLETSSNPRQIVLDFESELLRSLGYGLPATITQRNLVSHIESILEKPLKSRKILLQIASEPYSH